MDERRHHEKDPWDQGLYETGRTRPPKRHTGLIAILLVLVIFLSGLVSVLGILNVRLFAQLADLARQEEEEAVSFINETHETIAAPREEPEEDEEKTLPTEGAASIQLIPAPASVDNITQEGGLSLQEIYDRSIPSVVSISCESYAGSSTGTGVILSSDGYLVTNSHVVENAQQITVLLTDESSYEAALIGADAVSDLAVLHIEAENLVPAEFGDSGSLRVGDSVVAIGDPLGAQFRGTMTNGIISAINRDVTTDGRTMTLIQTNAALNTGNSGGPLINCHGQVIGINTMKISTFTDESGVEGLGFAIPSATVKEIAEQLMNQGYVSGRPTLGLIGEPVSNFNQYYYRMPAGMYINHVEEDTSAAEVGIAAGDILISVNDIRVTDMDSLNSVIYNCEVGDNVTVVIYRAGQRYSVHLTLTEAKG